MRLQQSCTTSNGSYSEETFDFLFDPLYDLPATLDSIAGMYDVEDGSILEIGVDGSLFSQAPDSGCVRNGTVAIIFSNMNLYPIEYVVDGCSDTYDAWNQSHFEGLLYLDNTGAAHYIEYAVIGEVGDRELSVVSRHEKI